MTDTMRRAVKPGDLVIYFLVIAAAVVSAIAPYRSAASDALYAEVSYAGEKTLYPLAADTVVNLAGEGYALTLVIADGCAYISHSDCPDRICVHTGKISRAGQVIVCVPARISVKITGSPGGADAVAG